MVCLLIAMAPGIIVCLIRQEFRIGLGMIVAGVLGLAWLSLIGTCGEWPFRGPHQFKPWRIYAIGSLGSIISCMVAIENLSVFPAKSDFVLRFALALPWSLSIIGICLSTHFRRWFIVGLPLPFIAWLSLSIGEAEFLYDGVLSIATVVLGIVAFIGCCAVMDRNDYPEPVRLQDHCPESLVAQFDSNDTVICENHATKFIALQNDVEFAIMFPGTVAQPDEIETARKLLFQIIDLEKQMIEGYASRLAVIEVVDGGKAFLHYYDHYVLIRALVQEDETGEFTIRDIRIDEPIPLEKTLNERDAARLQIRLTEDVPP